MNLVKRKIILQLDLVLDNKNKKNEILYGYQPSFIEINFKKLIKVILSLLQINGNNKYSNWILESINPRILVQSKIDRSIKFKWITGNNRLLWRATTFDTEETMMVKWISQFKEEDVFLDIGANCGVDLDLKLIFI